MDIGSGAITNTPVARKKNVALLFDRGKHVLGINKEAAQQAARPVTSRTWFSALPSKWPEGFAHRNRIHRHRLQ